MHTTNLVFRTDNFVFRKFLQCGLYQGIHCQCNRPWERFIGIGEVLFIPVSVARRDLVRHPALASPYISIGQLMDIVRRKFLFS